MNQHAPGAHSRPEHRPENRPTNRPGNLLQLNVGFLMHGAPGMRREFPLALPAIALADGLHVDRIEGAFSLSRTSEGLWLEGELRVVHPGQCARCLVAFARVSSLPLAELIGLPGILPRAGPSEFAVLEDGRLDLLPLVRAELLIAAAERVLCRPDCQGLCPECGQNRNEATCSCAMPADPRWSSLAEQWSSQHPEEDDADE